MKRSVAIYGPTPQFVRWTISHSCPLRDLDEINLPDGTFRQLRGLREYSVGLIENRVIDGICIHPTARSNDIDAVLGFSGSEITSPHGGDTVIADCCGRCPANAWSVQREGIWAGCYGWLAATSSFCFESILRRTKPSAEIATLHNPIEFDFVRRMDETIVQLGKSDVANELFKPTSPRWYGIWNTSTLSGRQVVFLAQVFEQLVLTCLDDSRSAECSIGELVALRDALRIVAGSGMTLHVDLVPPGFSDGQTWTLATHCPDCKSQLKPETSPQKCEACGRTGNPHGETRSKVLGLRPYVQLTSVIGQERTANLLKRHDAELSNRGER